MAILSRGALLLGLCGSLAACGTPSPAPPAAGLSAAPSLSAPPAVPAALAGSSLPVPPHQLEPWHAPRGVELPATVIAAVEALFAQGFADPRGLEYREVEIQTGTVWGGTGPVAKTRAWVIPTADGRYGISWTGLVYPLISVGAKQDAAADATAALRGQGAANSKLQRPGLAIHEVDAIAHTRPTPLWIALLLRIGEHKVARDLWTAWVSALNPKSDDDAAHIRDPYLAMATEWAWALFDRAVTAHMRADDTLALASARSLSAIGPKIEAEADRRGFTRRSGRDGTSAPHLGFLDPLPELLADQERRAAERAAPPPPAGDAIASAIRALDQVDARQWGQPGGVDLASDARVKEIVGAGEAAVEPLLAVLEDDVRLTRSVHFWRDFSRQRSILGVHEAAYVALAGILQTSFFSAVSTGDNLSARGVEGRRAVAAAVRAYWHKWRGIPLVERWYRVLADDGSPPDQWLEAAKNITQPTNVTVARGSMAFSGMSSAPAGSAPPGLRGEALRGKTGPSVTELMAKRVGDLGQRIGANRGDIAPLHAACDMAQLLGAWDARGGAPALARQMKIARDLTAKKGDRSHFGGIAMRCVANLTAARVKGGDAAALDEYAAWVAGILPEDADWYLRETLDPLWENAGHRAIEHAADVLFGDPASPWTHLTKDHSIGGLLEVPMVRLGGFRKLVLRELGNRARIGVVEVRDDKQWSYAIDGGSSAGSSLDKNDPHPPAPGTKHDLRACDLVAMRLGHLDGAPLFRAYWPEPVRDEALRAVIAFVRAQAKAAPARR